MVNRGQVPSYWKRGESACIVSYSANKYRHNRWMMRAIMIHVAWSYLIVVQLSMNNAHIFTMLVCMSRCGWCMQLSGIKGGTRFFYWINFPLSGNGRRANALDLCIFQSASFSALLSHRCCNKALYVCSLYYSGIKGSRNGNYILSFGILM